MAENRSSSLRQVKVTLDTIDVTDQGNPKNNGRWVRLSQMMLLVAKVQHMPDPLAEIEKALDAVDDRD